MLLQNLLFKFCFCNKTYARKVVATAPFVPRGHSNDKKHFLFVGTFLNPRAPAPVRYFDFSPSEITILKTFSILNHKMNWDDGHVF